MPESPKSNSVKVNELEHAPGHGLNAASILAAGDNDGDGIVGIAPRAKVLPMFQGNGIELPITHQLQRLYCGKPINAIDPICKGQTLPKTPLEVDVISISLSRTINGYDLYFANKTYENEVRQQLNLPPEIIKGTGVGPSFTPLIVNLYKAIYKLTINYNVIIVAAAGNNDIGYDRSIGSESTQMASIPASMNQVISVGAYQNDGGVTRRATFDIYNNDLAFGSNYGLLVDIYAPGKGLWVQGYDYDTATQVYQPRWNVIEGTSFATPLVAGTVAMMKSVDKSLTFADVYNILRRTSTPLTDSSFNRGFTVPHQAYGLNSLKAVEETIRTRGSGDKAAKSYCLQYTFSGAPGSPDRALIDVNSAIPGSGEVVAVLKGEYLTNSLQGLQPGDYVEALGWSQAERPSLPPNRLEVIQASKKASGHCQDLSFRISSAPNPLPNPSVYGAQGLIYQGLITQAYGGQTLAIPAEGNLNNATVRIGDTLAEEINTRSDAVLFKLPVNLTPGRYDIHLSTDGGSVTLAEVLDYQRSLPNDYVFGLFAKLYANTDVMPVENLINTLTPGGAEPFKPAAVVIVPNLALNPVTNDAFGVGLPNFYVADIQGTLTIEAGQEGLYDFALLHDDGALLDIDGQRIISAGRYPTAPEVMSTGSKHLSAGMHTIRVQRYQYTGRDPLILSWRKPNTTEFEVIPIQAFSHATSIQTSADSQLKPGVLGRFFSDVSAEPPYYPYGSKLYDQINFTDPTLFLGDPFGIGRIDSFAGLFSGYLKLPAGYTAGTYQLVIGHDDGSYFYFDGELKFNDDGPTEYIEHTADVLLEPGKFYPFLLHYQEYTGSAILGFYWIKPDGTRELIPAEAYWR